MEPYKHTVQYYETDMMGIAHHSNYIRWMEEARSAFLREIGWGYERFEKEGIVSPVTALDCKYRRTTTYADDVFVRVFIADFNGIRLRVGYEMRNSADEVVFNGHSEHCFLDAAGKIVRMTKAYPEFCEAITDYIEA
ncbi:MAG: acyl-CoA thioesterase [Lachnospiraceae bacterium]|nr:acyl-CoA thioesterase [Lachnospiraceae bacterium]